MIRHPSYDIYTHLLYKTIRYIVKQNRVLVDKLGTGLNIGHTDLENISSLSQIIRTQPIVYK